MTIQRARANQSALPSSKPVSAAVRKRIRAVAAEEGVPVPENILDAQGAPSAEIMAFCDRTHVTLDFIFLGERPKYRSGPARDGGMLDRIHSFCRWFDLDPPALKGRGGDVAVTDELLSWIWREGADLNWLATGSPQGMAASIRSRKQGDNEILEAVRQYGEEEQAMLVVAIRAIAEDGMKPEDAIGAWRKAVEEKRAAGSCAT